MADIHIDVGGPKYNDPVVILCGATNIDDDYVNLQNSIEFEADQWTDTPSAMENINTVTCEKCLKHPHLEIHTIRLTTI